MSVPHSATELLRAQSYPLGEDGASEAMSLLALAHTRSEHLIYKAMLAHVKAAESRVGCFSTRSLMQLPGINSYSTARRGLAGLVEKLSIERVAGGNGLPRAGRLYLVYAPKEVLERRRAAGLPVYANGLENVRSAVFRRAVRRVVELDALSRREVQVALCCAEGLTNAQIGAKLRVSEQTVKFHLRNIFQKFGLQRRTELISRLLSEGESRG
jgi:DNA-binding CsgD family transcriptional regulator